MSISMIACMDKNRIIGLNGDMPWGRDLPTDLRHFKELTEGHTLIMGRKTFESLGSPLFNREHVVITRDKDYRVEHPDVALAYSIDFVLDVANQLKQEEVFVIGGAEIFNIFMPHADKLYITEVQHTFAGDTIFPEIDKEQWRLRCIEYPIQSDRDKYEIQFMEYMRK